MTEVLRANYPHAGEMGDTVEPLGLSSSFADLNMDAAVQGRHQQQGSQSYVVRLPRRAFSCTDQLQGSTSSTYVVPQTQRKPQQQQTPRQPTEAVEFARAQAQRRDETLAAYHRLLRNPSYSRGSNSGRNLPAAAAAAAARITTSRSPAQQPPTTNSQKQPATAAAAAATATATAVRPGMPLTPQRSYSVMDVEPVPLTQQPGTALTLPDLPAELHYAIFDLLDPIDGTCLGLASRQFYSLFRHINLNSTSHSLAASDGSGKKAPAPQLGARREGPNDMEWVWRHAGPFVSGSGSGSRSGSGSNKQNTLAVLSPRGQVYCRKCRTARCELHKHIRDFFPADWEYCEVAQKFGRPADDEDGARPVCYRSSPRHPHRCGRHTRRQRVVRLT